MKNITAENYDKVDHFGFLGTFSGKELHFMNPHPDEICIGDIANALSKNCRYAGQVNNFYSVAEHSILMAEYFLAKEDRERAFVALMHDATEAYLVDIPRPMKPHLGGYLEMEAKLQDVIFKKYNIKGMDEEVKHLDCHIVHDEAKVLFNTTPDWVANYESFGIEIKCWTHEEAKKRFLHMFEYLTTSNMEKIA